jgi:hypothetical protein
VLVDVTFVRMVEVTIVQVVGVAAVTYRGVSTTWPMLMSMVSMGWGGAARHDTASFRVRCVDAAARICAAMSINGQLVNRRPCAKGDHLEHLWPRLPCRYANPFPENEVWPYPENAVREKVR